LSRAPSSNILLIHEEVSIIAEILFEITIAPILTLANQTVSQIVEAPSGVCPSVNRARAVTL